jgi:EXS family
MKARKEVIIVLYHIVISPFGLVRFKHFFLADVITSFVNPLKDIGLMAFFFINGNWLDSKFFTINDNYGLKLYTVIVPLLPFWFRFAQCIVRFRETNLKAHLVNAGKYFSCLLIQLSALFRTLYPLSPAVTPAYITICIISTLYCLAWDYRMDWGLFLSNEPDKRYLRNKLYYPRWFYYYAMISNCIMRFFWILNVFTYPTWVS